MDWLSGPDRVKIQWRLVWLNVSAAAVNIIVGLVVWKWMSLANLFSAGFSGWVAWGLYTKIPQIEREQGERITRILRGDFG